MRNDVCEANVILAKCRDAKRTFGIRVERRTNNVWYCNWAFKINEKSAENEGYKSSEISGRVDIEAEYPGCPYCGRSGWVSCGKCKRNLSEKCGCD